MNVHYFALFSSEVRIRIRVRIRFSVWLVSCYAHVFVQLYGCNCHTASPPPLQKSPQLTQMTLGKTLAWE